MVEYFVVVMHEGQWWVKYKEGNKLVSPFNSYLSAKMKAYIANKRISDAEKLFEEAGVR